jgi:squalene-hopene/tetraprenyl-beta-curcumene cyclase
MVVAVPLTFNDRAAGILHPLTRTALDRMLKQQRPDGGWIGIGGAPRTFITAYEETLFAGLGIAVAPDDYGASAPAAKALEGIRKYAAVHPPNTPYQKGMLLWASSHVAGLMSDADRKAAAGELLALQRADGGWTLQGLLEDDQEWQRGKFAAELPSDGYGTGFVIFTARQAGVPADDARLQRGIAWLKANQRASGRWFTPTASRRKLHLPSNSGTGYAILALEACGEIPRAGR